MKYKIIFSLILGIILIGCVSLVSAGVIEDSYNNAADFFKKLFGSGNEASVNEEIINGELNSLGRISSFDSGSGKNEAWPGFNKGGRLINSNPASIEGDLKLAWTFVMDPQTKSLRNEYSGSYRSKNLAIRSGQIAILVPNNSKQDFGFIDIVSGQLVRSFPTELDRTTSAEFNPLGVEGRDLRNGQFVVFWHQNGNIYAKSAGDHSESKAYDVANGSLMMSTVGYESSNQAGHFSMSDNSNWVYQPNEGHTFYSVSTNTFISSIEKNISILPTLRYIVNYTWGQSFARCNPFLVDGDWIYLLGPTNHPKIKVSGELTAYDYSWLGANIRAFKQVGQTANSADQQFVNGKVPEFYWVDMNSFIAIETDTGSHPKAWTLGDNEIYLVTQSGVTYTETDASVDFTQSLVLNGIDRYNGSSWKMNLGINCRGCTMDIRKNYYNSYTTFQPQISYLNNSVNGNEVVAVMLPEALKHGGWHDPYFNPYNTNSQLNSRISVIDVTHKNELWTYVYPHGETTPNWNYGANTNTKMLIAGDSVYVAYVKTATPLSNYIDPNNEYALTLYVDKFDLETGSKTRYLFPLNVTGNTIQLDDLASVEGKLFALITYREWHENFAYSGGAQLIAAVGGDDISCVDSDLDGWNTTLICNSGLGIDCNDVLGSGESIHPGALEVCNDFIDNDCDSDVDCDDNDCTGDSNCESVPNWDVVIDGVINIQDLSSVAKEFGRTDCSKLNNWCNRADVNRLGQVNILDLVTVGLHFS